MQAQVGSLCAGSLRAGSKREQRHLPLDQALDLRYLGYVLGASLVGHLRREGSRTETKLAREHLGGGKWLRRPCRLCGCCRLGRQLCSFLEVGLAFQMLRPSATIYGGMRASHGEGIAW